MRPGRRFVAILIPIILFAGYRVLTGLPESGALEPATPVFTVQLNGEAVAYPFDILRQWRAVNDIVGGQPIVIFWTPDATARGAAAAFESRLGGQHLAFLSSGSKFIDHATRSEWNESGLAVDGELKGQQLTPAPTAEAAWWLWSALHPKRRVFFLTP